MKCNEIKKISHTAINRNIPAPAVINGFNFTYLVPAVDTNPYVKYFLFICAYYEGPVTVTGRHAEVPPSGLPHSDLARARVRVGGGKN